MKWLVLSSRVKTARSRIRLNSAVKKRRKKARPPSPRRRTGDRLWLRFVLVLLVLGGVVTGAWWGLCHSSSFIIREIQVVNNHSYSTNEVIEMSGLKTGGNIFRFDPAVFRSRLRENVNFRDASIQRIFPDTVRIAIFEREPRARVKFGRLYTIDDCGVVLRGRKERSGGKLPVILGLKIKKGSLYPPEEGEVCLALLRELDRQNINSLVDISEINPSDSEVIEMRTSENLKIKLGKGDYEKQLGRLKVVLSNLGDNSPPARAVDLRYSHIPVSYEE